MATPLYVVKALAQVRENGSVNMMNRAGVESLVSSDRAQEWLFKASDSEFMDALNDMGAYISSDDETGEDLEIEDEGDNTNGNYSY